MSECRKCMRIFDWNAGEGYSRDAQDGTYLCSTNCEIAEKNAELKAHAALIEAQRAEIEQLLAACKSALADYETINAAAQAAGIHPFTIGPAQLRAASEASGAKQ